MFIVALGILACGVSKRDISVKRVSAMGVSLSDSSIVIHPHENRSRFYDHPRTSSVDVISKPVRYANVPPQLGGQNESAQGFTLNFPQTLVSF
ncbi:MAG: hypothetical protein ACPGPS_09355 [Rubripirellula sp.]